MKRACKEDNTAVKLGHELNKQLCQSASFHQTNLLFIAEKSFFNLVFFFKKRGQERAVRFELSAGISLAPLRLVFVLSEKHFYFCVFLKLPSPQKCPH